MPDLAPYSEAISAVANALKIIVGGGLLVGLVVYVRRKIAKGAKAEQRVDDLAGAAADQREGGRELRDERRKGRDAAERGRAKRRT